MRESETKLSAIDLHRERARKLRVVTLHRWMEMKLAVTNATERTVDIIKLEADIDTYEAVVRMDEEMERLAAEKERADKQ